MFITTAWYVALSLGGLDIATTQADRYQKISGDVSKCITNNFCSCFQLQDGLRSNKRELTQRNGAWPYLRHLNKQKWRSTSSHSPCGWTGGELFWMGTTGLKDSLVASMTYTSPYEWSTKPTLLVNQPQFGLESHKAGPFTSLFGASVSSRLDFLGSPWFLLVSWWIPSVSAGDVVNTSSQTQQISQHAHHGASDHSRTWHLGATWLPQGLEDKFDRFGWSGCSNSGLLSDVTRKLDWFCWWTSEFLPSKLGVEASKMLGCHHPNIGWHG